MPISSAHVLEIAPTRGWRALDIREIWAYRELLYILVWRDLKVRYRQTILGALWVVGQPLLTMIVFTVLFNRVARFDAGPIPYALFVLASLVPWNFFSFGVQTSGNSLVGSSYLVSKIYFPRLIVPASALLAALADMGVNFLLLIALMMFYGFVPGVSIVILPLALLVLFALALGLGLWLSALNVEYRDVRVVLPFLFQLWLFLTPVAYPLQELPQTYRTFVLANPVTGAVEMFRATLFGADLPWMLFAYSTAFAVIFLVSGAFYFRRMERVFADIL